MLSLKAIVKNTQDFRYGYMVLCISKLYEKNPP